MGSGWLVESRGGRRSRIVEDCSSARRATCGREVLGTVGRVVARVSRKGDLRFVVSLFPLVGRWLEGGSGLSVERRERDVRFVSILR